MIYLSIALNILVTLTLGYCIGRVHAELIQERSEQERKRIEAEREQSGGGER